MELMRGYKTTDIGVIPSDWEAATIGEVTTFSGGSQPPRSTFKFAPAAGYVRLIQIRDYKTDEYASYIPETMARKTCRTDDIMIGRYGPPIFQILRGIEGAYNVALIKAIPNERISRDYLFNVLKQEKLFQLIDSLSRRSSGQTGVEMPALKAFSLPLPPIEEQRVISSALSDVDELLATLDHMIAKKRDLKQATMQQLLTGKTRLPGFGGEWETKPFSAVLNRLNAKSHQVQASEYQETGRFPVVDQGKDFVVGFSDRIDKRFRCPDGGVIVFGDHTCIVKFIDFDFLVGADGTQILHGKHGQNTRFHALQLQYRGIEATGYNRHFKILKEREFFVPPLPEQDAIASALSSMDAELSALEARRDKAFNLKQAMMQELLTGKTRLV